MLTEEGWADKLIHAPLDEPLHQWLLSQLLGVSRVAARELAVRATGDAAAPVRVCTPQTIAAAVQGLFMPLNDGWWTPHVALDEAGAVIAFTPFEPRQFARIEPAVDISQAMWRFFEGRGMADSYAAAREAVSDLIIDTGRRLENRLSKLRKEEGDEAELADLRIAGELLLMYQNQVPGGAGEVSLLGYDGTPLVVALNPALTPVENAQAYFRRYEKMRRAADHIPGLVEKLKSEQAYLDQLEADLALAESRPEIDAVRDSLAAAGWAPRRRQKIADQVSEPRRFEVGGFRIYVGRNSRQNEQITFRRAGPEDLWLHVRGLPGAHVVIRRGRQEVPEDIIKRAASLAAFYSRARGSESQVAVDVTERRFVRRMRGKHPGMVTYRNERTVWVTGKDIQDWAADAC
jgi:predicted ribosome quality control (RQC) complex YloA/Tae2 family protein